MLGSFLKFIGTICFYIQYYIILGFMFIVNLFGWIYDYLLSKNSKRRINPMSYVHEDVFVNRDSMIFHKSFSFQEYQFQTEDKAYISFWRVQCLQVQQKKPYPIIIMHGLLDCSMSWFLHQQKQRCLPYVLAKQGYDVWVGNNRGTKHSTTNSHQQNYWQYSLDQLIYYDQPTIINSVLNQTRAQKIIYIGHSQGSTQFLTGMGIHKHLRDKIKCFIGLGTVIALQGVTNHNTLKVLAKFKGCEILKLLGFKTVLFLPQHFCRTTGTLIYLTSFYFNIFFKIVTMLCGTPNKNKINLNRFGVIIAHEPGGCSINNCLHWVQMYRKKHLMKFDHGKKKNITLYGQQQPPHYDFSHLQNIPFNNYIFKGSKDAVISQLDFNKIIKRIPQQKLKVFQLEDYAHLDYVWAIDADEHLYYPIVQILKKQH